MRLFDGIQKDHTSVEVTEICRRVKSQLSGSPPFSLCQLRMDDEDVSFIKGWFKTLDSGSLRRLKATPSHFGLLFLLLATEVNRREATNGQFWNTLPPCFDLSVNGSLFVTGASPQPWLRGALKDACRRFQLRNVFERSDYSYKWMISGYLQFGIPKERLVNPASMYQWSEAAGLLISDRELHSQSFQKLWHMLRRYLSNKELCEETREELLKSEWVLPEWIEPILKNFGDALSILRPDKQSDSAEELLVKDPVLQWIGNTPTFRCSLCPLDDRFRLYDRVTLYNEKQRLARWTLQRDSFSCDRNDQMIEFSCERPSQVIELRDRNANVLAYQTVDLWNPDVEIQSYKTGNVHYLRYPSGGKVHPSDILLKTKTIGDQTWASLSHLPQGTTIKDANGEVLWESGREFDHNDFDELSVDLPFDRANIGEVVNFVIYGLPADAFIRYVRLNGKPIELSEQRRGGTFRLTEEIVARKTVFRIGVEREGTIRPISRTVSPPIKALLRFSEHENKWAKFPAGEFVTNHQLRFGEKKFCHWNSETQFYFFEGSQFRGVLFANEKRLRFPELVGTGAPLEVRHSFVDNEAIRLGYGVDFGIIRNCFFDEDRKNLLIELNGEIEPSDQYSIYLLDQNIEICWFDATQCQVDNNLWSLPVDSVTIHGEPIVAIAYDGLRVGTHYTPESLESLFQQRILSEGATCWSVLLRWFRLPVLLPNRMNRLRIEQFVSENFLAFLDAWLFSSGLPEGMRFAEDHDLRYEHEILRRLFLEQRLKTIDIDELHNLFQSKNFGVEKIFELVLVLPKLIIPLLKQYYYNEMMDLFDKLITNENKRCSSDWSRLGQWRYNDDFYNDMTRKFNEYKLPDDGPIKNHKDYFRHLAAYLHGAVEQTPIDKNQINFVLSLEEFRMILLHEIYYFLLISPPQQP